MGTNAFFIFTRNTPIIHVSNQPLVVYIQELFSFFLQRSQVSLKTLNCILLCTIGFKERFHLCNMSLVIAQFSILNNLQVKISHYIIEDYLRENEFIHSPDLIWNFPQQMSFFLNLVKLFIKFSNSSSSFTYLEKRNCHFFLFGKMFLKTIRFNGQFVPIRNLTKTLDFKHISISVFFS